MTKDEQKIIQTSIKGELRQYSHHPNDDDDLISCAWIRVLTYFSRYDPLKGKLSTWAAYHARGAFMDYIRANYSPRLKDRNKSVNIFNYHILTQAQTRDEQDGDSEFLTDNLSNLLPLLSTTERVVLAGYLDGNTQREIADKLGVVESRISQVMTRIRKTFKDAINKRAKDCKVSLLDASSKKSGT